MNMSRIDDTSYDVKGNFKCSRCAGTGRFVTYVENNVPKGPGGHCFRCGGKGFHNQDDRKRNNGYDCRGVYQSRDGEHHNALADMKRSSLNELI